MARFRAVAMRSLLRGPRIARAVAPAPPALLSRALGHTAGTKSSRGKREDADGLRGGSAPGSPAQIEGALEREARRPADGRDLSAGDPSAALAEVVRLRQTIRALAENTRGANPVNTPTEPPSVDHPLSGADDDDDLAHSDSGPWGEPTPVVRNSSVLVFRGQAGGGTRLKIVVPARELADLPSASKFGFGFVAVWLGMVVSFTASAGLSGAPLVFVAFTLPFYGVGAYMARELARPLVHDVELELSTDSFRYSRAPSKDAGEHPDWLASALGQTELEGSLSDLSCAVEKVSRKDIRGRRLVIVWTGTNDKHTFGETLSKPEVRAIVKEVNWFLKAVKGARKTKAA